jgi:hypothetical protein
VSVVSGLDLARFAARSHRRLDHGYLRDQETRRSIRPEWRFAWLDAGCEIRARVLYWGLPGADRPCLLDVVLGDDDGATTELLAESLRRLGIGAIDYQATRALGAGRGADEPTALEACGFALVATQRRLCHSGPPPPIRTVSGVDLRSIADVGYEALVPLVAAVRRATADRATTGRTDAPSEIAALRDVAHQPSWWTVAYDDCSPVGFVLPIQTDGGPVIGDIGVVPMARGRGIGCQLLAHGTATMLGESGRVGADVDDGNVAMLATAASVGYIAIAGRAHWVRTVPDHSIA